MRNTRKILVTLLVLMTILVSLVAVAIPASAANMTGGEKLYLVPSANWNQSNARFAAYFFGNGEAWVSMTKVEGQSNLYEVTVPAGNWTNVIFCRMNPSASANNWNNKWNQTSDLTYNGTSNCYTVKEGTWDKGGGTWSTYGNACTHANVGPAATCTTAQTCLDCGDPVASALGHSYNSDHLCTRCNEQATFTVAGSGAHLGTEWDTGNTANDMSYADGVYTKVYTNVAAGSYKFKVARDHDWGTAYPDADKAYTVATAGSTVTITLKGTTVDVKVEAPHVHSWSDATCTEAQKCECGETQGEALGHSFAEGSCSVCGAEDPNYVPPHEHNFVEGKCECGESDPNYVPPHVNALVVGDTNKIVVSGETLNAYNLPIEWVAFVADEKAHYKFVGDNGALAYIFDLEYNAVCGYTGEADLEAGTYLICVGNGLVGEFNVAVTKSEIVPPHEHNFVEGKCECGEVDPDYVAPEVPAANDKLINFSTWEEFAKGTYADGDTYKHNDYFTFIYGKNSRVDASSKTWEDFSGTLRFSLGGTTNSGVPTKNAIQITVDGAHTLKIWYVAGGDARYFELRDADGNAIATTTAETVKNSQYYSELEIPAAGVYYLTIPADNNYIFQLELVAKAVEEPIDPPHVNSLVVGDTNKIVVNGETLNQYNLPIEWVAFVADEKAHYEFVGDNGALVYIFDASYNLLCGGTGKADLEAGTYLICVGNGLVGEFNVAVTKSEIVIPEPPADDKWTFWISSTDYYTVDGYNIKYNGAGNSYACVGTADIVPLAVGNNTFVITITNNGSAAARVRVDIQATNTIGNHAVCNTNAVGGDVWTDFEWGGSIVTVPAGESVTLTITYDENTERGAVANLVIFVDAMRGDGEMYSADITLSDMAFSYVSDEPVVEPETPKLALGDNTVVIDGSEVNLTGQAIAWLELVVTNAGTYKVSSADLNCFICTDKDFYTNLCGWTGIADLEPGTYYVAVGNAGVTGEFVVTLETDVEAPAVNTLVVGDNKYVINQPLKDIGYEFLYFTADKDGTYTFSGVQGCWFFIWPDYPNQLTVPDTALFVSNIDPLTAEFVDSVEVELSAGCFYLVGFKFVVPDLGVDTPVGEYDVTVTYTAPHEHNFVEGKCECGETDPNYQPPHEHNFVEGKCECGEEDPNYQPPEQGGDDTPSEPEAELNFFQKIIKAITDFFANIGNWFKNLFAK